jgi:hypothetical protein
MTTDTAEHRRLDEDARRTRDWKRWGPYLSERQWGTVREDYSPAGECWTYFPHDHARSRAYRWGEDGLLGICDRQARLCFAVALWNERDPILKERLFGLTGPEGNHGEDVKEVYFYLDSTPTHSWMRARYRYPQAAFPYARLVDENRRRGKDQREFELLDTGVLDDGRFFDVTATYAKASPDDVLVAIDVENAGPDPATLHVLPTLWCRNTWSWGRGGEDYWRKPTLTRVDERTIAVEHASLGAFRLQCERTPEALLFTENETDFAQLFGTPSRSPYTKDAFHEYVVDGHRDAVNPAGVGTKAAAHYRVTLAPGERTTLHLRLVAADEARADPFGAGFAATWESRRAEADAFYAAVDDPALTPDERQVAREASAGLLWSKQFYWYDVAAWLDGDPAQPAPPASRRHGRNADWRHLYARDVISMPDKWEYPWFAAWDLAFHMIPLARLDPTFAKEQLVLLTREWYMHANGELPAYEFAFGDVNPPVHAWAAWRVYKMTAPRGQRDRVFLSRIFQKCILNFTWWVNRKDAEGNNLFGGGFLGLDNIGVFDRSAPLPHGGTLEQADGTAWMAFYCLTLLDMALELARENPAVEDMASKFFEHFVAIADAMNHWSGSGLWCDVDGFYYDQAHLDGCTTQIRVRSLVGLLPMLAVLVLEREDLDRLPGFTKRMDWFLRNRRDLAQQIDTERTTDGCVRRLLAIPSRARLERLVRYLLDEGEFLSPYGIRSVSKYHAAHPYELRVDDTTLRVAYTPGESTSGLFGGNSNWRGPVWFPLNYLIIEALERWHYFYKDSLTVEIPTGSGRRGTLFDAAREIERRLNRLFVPDAEGRRPCHGDDARWATDPRWRDHVLFHEYFDGDTGRGCGASHQTGWTALVVRGLLNAARERRR